MTRRAVLIAFLIVLAGIISLIPTARAEVELAPVFDPQGDVVEGTQTEGQIPVEGFEHLDVVSINAAYESGVIPLEKIVFELTVLGTITDSQSIQYIVSVVADGTEYLLLYSNGECSGYNVDNDMSTIAVICAGAGSSTLEFTVTANALGEPVSTLTYTSVCLESRNDGSGQGQRQYLDMAPGKIVRLTTPKDKEAIYEQVTISGTTSKSTSEIQWVEVQIDSTSTSGWHRAASEDGWKHWGFDWDTTSVAPGSHTIHARCFDGENYHTDSITVIVDQALKSNPPTLQKPPIAVGDRFQYVSGGTTAIFGFSVELVSEQMYTVAAYETMNLNGAPTTIYREEIEQIGSANLLGLSIPTDGAGYKIITADEYAVVEDYMKITMTIPLVGKSTTESKIHYSPPSLVADFPVSVTKHWTSTNTVQSTINSSSNDGSSSNTDTSIITTNYHCLSKEMTTVPAGTFEAFIVHSAQEENGGYSLNYYTTELSAPIKIEQYSADRDLMSALVLNQFIPGSGYTIMVQNISTEQDELLVGKPVTLIARLRNVGEQTCNNCPVTFKVNNQKLATEKITIPPGTYREVSTEWTPEEDKTYSISVSTEWDERTVNFDVFKPKKPPASTPGFEVLGAVLIIAMVAAGFYRHRLRAA